MKSSDRVKLALLTFATSMAVALPAFAQDSTAAEDAATAGIVGASLLFSACMGIVGLVFFAFWVWMLVDCIKSKALSDGEKIAWTLVIVFTHALGALIYFLAGRRRTA
jgi:hypothetical protein